MLSCGRERLENAKKRLPRTVGVVSGFGAPRKNRDFHPFLLLWKVLSLCLAFAEDHHPPHLGGGGGGNPRRMTAKADLLRALENTGGPEDAI